MMLKRDRFFVHLFIVVMAIILIPQNVWAYQHSLHKELADKTIEMNAKFYPWLKRCRESILWGCIQPDSDRKKATRRLQLWDNHYHKTDARRIVKNYYEAIQRYKNTGDIQDSCRILAKTFHYWADQTEPLKAFKERRIEPLFQKWTNMSSRKLLEHIFDQIFKDPEGIQFFYDAVNGWINRHWRSFNPLDVRIVQDIRDNIKNTFANEVITQLTIISNSAGQSDRAGEMLMKAHVDFIAKIVAMQNLTIYRFAQQIQ